MLARRKSGFTLIELLVVIAIIAILAAILFPVFARAREAARKSTCQSNMKEIAMALQTYWNDYDATLPSSYNASGGNLNQSGFELFATGVGFLPPGSADDTQAANGPQTWAQMLYNAHKGKDICFCPSDGQDHNPPKTEVYNISLHQVSYWWKYAIDKAWTDVNMKCQKESDFGFNADQIVFYECAGFHSGASQGLKNGVQINVAFLDTHVKSVSIVNCSQDTNSTTFVTTSKPASGEPAFFNFDNNLVKSTTNPPPPATAATYVDPRQYSDMLP